MQGELPPFSFQEVTEGLYLGSTPWLPSHLQELYSEGIRSIISLEGESDKTPIGMDVFLWLPLLDGTAPTMDQLRMGIRTIDELLRMGHKVFVHCRFGVGRAPTLVAAHFVKHGMSVEEAVSFLKKIRPTVNPLSAQLARLEEYRTHVQRTTIGQMDPHRVYPKNFRQKIVERKGTAR